MSQDLKKLLGEVIEMHRAELCKMADRKSVGRERV